MNEDEAPSPIDIGLFGTDREVAHPESMAHAIEQAQRRQRQRIGQSGQA